MHTGIPRKTSPSSTSAFKPVLNNKSSSTSSISSRLPTSRLPTSSKKKGTGSSSRSSKENIPPVASNSKKQGSTRSTALQKSSNGAEEPKIEKKNNNKGDGLGDVQSIGSKHMEEISFTHPVLADLSTSVINENSRIDFDYNVIDYDREYDINFKLESSFSETRLAARHNDSIEVTLKRTRARSLCRVGRVANDDNEASISLDYIPESDVEGVLGVEYIIDDEEADDTFDLSDFLSKIAPLSAPPAAPLPPLPTVPAPVPVTTAEADDTFDLSDFLNKNAPIEREERLMDTSLSELVKVEVDYDQFLNKTSAPITVPTPVEEADETFDLSDFLNNHAPTERQERLMDTSLSELMKVEIDYDREFPNTAVGRPPHIFVCRYKRDMKRKAAAQKALEGAACVQKNRCVIENEYTVDIPLQNRAPMFGESVLCPELHNVPSIPSLIVTSPSDGDLAYVAGNVPTIQFDDEIMASGSYKDFLLDSSFHNWTMRFGTLLPNEVNVDEDEEQHETPEMLLTSLDLPQIIITSPSDGDISFDNTILERLLLEYDEAGLLDEVY
ncbi:hypothetical protein APHAL10511_000042 [Amanita phalloides]|nr:hypothetical protein APHAL10511_000042 [Amanita phalloides]